MYYCKIDKCPECGHVLANEDVEFEETASYIPDMMWQVCPTHGRVSEFKWHPAWGFFPVKVVEQNWKPPVSRWSIKWLEPRFFKIK